MAGQSQRSRLRAVLAGTDATELVARTRNRVEVLRFHAHPKAVGRLAREVVSSGAGRGIGGLPPCPTASTGTSRPPVLGRLTARYRLAGDPSGPVVLRATGMPLDVVTELAQGARQVLAGLDLPGSTDAQERAAGSRILERALGRIVADVLRPPTPPGGWLRPWADVAELAAAVPATAWTLTGGLRVQLHGAVGGPPGEGLCGQKTARSRSCS